MDFLPLVGRILLAVPYLMFGFGHLADPNMVGFGAAFGVPSILVYLSGATMLVGALAIMVGYQARLAGGVLALVVLTIAIWMHSPMIEISEGLKQMGISDMTQMVNFMKNLSMAGGGLMIAYFGSGPKSIKA